MKNVAKPPRISRSTEDPRAEMAKKRSSAEGTGAVSAVVMPRKVPDVWVRGVNVWGVSERRPDPPPLETDDVKIVAAGTALWLVALVVLVVLRLTRDDIRDWWVEMCAAGVALGLLGIRFCVRRRRAIAAG